MKGAKLDLAFDIDDTLMYCIPYLCERANKEIHFDPPITPEEFSSWGISTPRTRAVYAYFNDVSFYENQPPIPGSQELVRDMSKWFNLIANSAVRPEFMTPRAKRIMELYPQIPKENIILGARKDIFTPDIILDDGGHNVLTSKAKYPVLMRRPWNRNISGRLTVNNYDDFRKVCETIRLAYSEDNGRYDCICLVGPSGAGKHDIADELTNRRCTIVQSYTTGPNRKHIQVSEAEFDDMSASGQLFEETYFAGIRYGLAWNTINRAFQSDMTPVIVSDICGAMQLKKSFNPLVVYCQDDEAAMMRQVLRKGESEESTISRLISMKAEMQNEQFCDISVSGLTPSEAADMICREIRDTEAA